MEKINWIEEAYWYNEFLNGEELPKLTEEQAKQYVKEELQNIIAINGIGELYENERKLVKLLNIEL